MILLAKFGKHSSTGFSGNVESKYFYLATVTILEGWWICRTQLLKETNKGSFCQSLIKFGLVVLDKLSK